MKKLMELMDMKNTNNNNLETLISFMLFLILYGIIQLARQKELNQFLLIKNYNAVTAYIMIQCKCGMPSSGIHEAL